MRHARTRFGFTLIETMIACTITMFTMSALIGLYVTARKFWYPSTLTMASTVNADRAMSRIVYGMNMSTGGLRSARGSTVSHWSDGDSWTITFNTNRWIMYNGASNTLSSSYAGLLARNVVLSTAGVNATRAGIMIRIVEKSGRSAVTNTYVTTVAFRN